MDFTGVFRYKSRRFDKSICSPFLAEIESEEMSGREEEAIIKINKSHQQQILKQKQLEKFIPCHICEQILNKNFKQEFTSFGGHRRFDRVDHWFWFSDL